MEIWKLCEGQSCIIAIEINEVHLGPSLIVLLKQGCGLYFHQSAALGRWVNLMNTIQLGFIHYARTHFQTQIGVWIFKIKSA